MKPPVAEELGFLGKAPIAFRARERLLARVASQVDDQVCFLYEAFLALGTGEGPVSGVKLLMAYQPWFVGKPPSALGALKRFLSRVDPPMDRQVLFVSEAAIAVLTGERFFTRVKPLVSGELGFL